ncbi:hypothetical protein HAX54_014776 [Datura stramonium]|uniref:WPP domain-associated protein n=1 Tax=Datura stramonium TaxID=4076 RepID=A0ABS8TQH5_DATST|nr:hypothetical protein [Datura stramonium]
MDNLFGEIDCRSKSDGIVMGILRCAMDKAHEKVQSEAGSIEFLHERSKFYELAVILVESGLSIVQEETDILESNREKVILDLIEMRHWLLGRIKVMKLLINEKDRELTERTDNELKLRQILESKDREVIFLCEKLENQRTMSEGSLDLGLLLKNIEGETSDSKSDSEHLNEERFRQGDFYHHITKINPIMTDHSLLRPEQNNVIQQMSSDIDILKETLDFAFGKRDNGEIAPLEKQWRCTIEKDMLSILLRGFIVDIQQRFESELRNLLGDQTPLGFSNENLLEFISEITTLCQEEEAFYSRHHEEKKSLTNKDCLGPWAKIQRTCSEPFPKVNQEDQEVSGSKCVAHKLIKNHQSNSSMEDKEVTSDYAFEIIKDEVGYLKEEVDNLNLQMSILEEIHLILYEGLFKDQNVASFDPTKNTESTTTLSLNQFDEKDGNLEIIVKDFGDDIILQESPLKEDVYEVFFVEMFKAWKEEKDDFDIELHIREDFYMFIMVEAVKDYVHTKVSEYLNPAYKKVEIDGSEESLIEKLDLLLKCLESEDDLLMKESFEIEEHNEQEILECEGVDERETIGWLLNDDESTFSCVNEKLEMAMKQLSTSKELLFDLEQSIGISTNALEKSNDDCVNTSIRLLVETEKPSQESIMQGEDNKVTLINPSDIWILAQLLDFHQVIQEFEVNVVQNLSMKSSRIEELKHQFRNLIVEPVSLIKKRKLLYKKAFLARCQNLKLAETEVDLLGDQVEALLHLLKNIHMILDENSTILSCHFQVFDILKLIKDELVDGVACASSS